MHSTDQPTDSQGDDCRRVRLGFCQRWGRIRVPRPPNRGLKQSSTEAYAAQNAAGALAAWNHSGTPAV
jgi:hypothetical protein